MEQSRYIFRFFGLGCFCNKILDISTMGKQALTSHAKSVKHKSAMKAQKTIHNMGAFLSKQSDQNVDVSVVLSLEETSHSQSPVDTNISSQTSSQIVKPNPFILNEHTAVAERIWTLKCVYSRFSYNSCKDVGSLFKVG